MVLFNLLVEQFVQLGRYFVNTIVALLIATTDTKRFLAAVGTICRFPVPIILLGLAFFFDFSKTNLVFELQVEMRQFQF